MGKPPRKPLGKHHVWTKEEEALLGTQSDAQIAKRLGLTPYIVMCRRRRLNIPPWQESRTQDEMAQLKERYQASLGKIPDAEIVRRASVSKLTVRRWRQQMNIAPAGQAGAKVKRWTGETEKLLGTMPDHKLAEQLGIPRGTVQSRRLALGIGPYVKWIKGRPGRVAIDGQKVRARRLELRLSYDQASANNKSRKSHLAKIEKGTTRTVMPETLNWLCEVLRCEPEAIRA
ncbi:MAG TPA: hypothetical protein VGB77_22275 [Abditibacteriaceae bacterium]|jgi:hypothetical protein